jgi:hypothetical protein
VSEADIAGLSSAIEAGAEGPDTRFVVTNLKKRNKYPRNFGKRDLWKSAACRFASLRWS